ncbi:hypothetical protein EI94DRAFT_1053227 [Lactarius quietus]|nr:hypothetical protein EI94DRAFT_1053227 [Lactarius quietus]
MKLLTLAFHKELTLAYSIRPGHRAILHVDNITVNAPSIRTRLPLQPGRTFLINIDSRGRLGPAHHQQSRGGWQSCQSSMLMRCSPTHSNKEITLNLPTDALTTALRCAFANHTRANKSCEKNNLPSLLSFNESGTTNGSPRQRGARHAHGVMKPVDIVLLTEPDVPIVRRCSPRCAPSSSACRTLRRVSRPCLLFEIPPTLR